MERVDELFRDLEQEVIETRNQTIKTDNSLRNLASDIKAIAKKQEAYEARMFLNSVAAYALFALLAFGGLFLFFRASIERAEVDRALVQEQHATFEATIAELEAEMERRREAEAEAYEFYELLASGRRDEVVERFPTVQGRLIDRATIELFRREVDRIRHELSAESFDLGSQHFENERWQEARDAFLRSMAYVELAHYSPLLHYRLAESLFELDDYTGAVRYYDLAIGADALDRTQSIIATFHRAEAFRRLDRYQEAIDAYRLFLRRFESHYWAASARDRIASIERRLEGE